MTDKPKRPSIRKKGLTRKQTIAIREYAKTDNQTQAGLVAYDTTNPKYATESVRRTLKKPEAQAYLAEWLEYLNPNWGEALGAAAMSGLDMALQSGDSEKVRKYIETMSNVTGSAAPKRSEKRELKAMVKLPGSE